MTRPKGRTASHKDNAHYGILGVSDGDARKAVEWARRTIDNTRAVLRS